MFIKSIGLFCGLLLILEGCDLPVDPLPSGQKISTASISSDVVLSATSPKRRYLVEGLAEAVTSPLMEPVAARISYDEMHTARILTPIAGRITRITAQPGDPVTTGMELLSMDSPDLGRMQAEYARALADQTLANRDFERESELFTRGITPEKIIEQVRAERERARSEAERARLQLANLGVHSNRMDNQFFLKSPINGIVTERHANPGQQVVPDNAMPLFVVSDISHLWVILDIFEKDLALVHPGQNVRLSVLAYPGEHFSARVDYIGQVVDETTRTVKVRCLLDNREHKLLPAMFASVEIESDALNKAIVIPLTALFTEGESDWLFTVTPEGHFHRQAVEVGLRLKNTAVIRKGISPGTRIVIDGALLLRNEITSDPDASGKP